MFKTLLLLFACVTLSSCSQAQTEPIYRDTRAPLEARVKDLFDKLTPEEKMELLTGTDFTTRPIPRLGVPAMGMVDAGQGVRGGIGSTQGPATAFPSGVSMASTWNTDLIARIGKAIGEETLNKGTGAQVLLGPAVNIHRSPLGGRNGEYFSEDPYLAAQLGVSYIQGMQSTGCAACVKHYAANNEEVDRDYVDVRVSERALREIYLPAFEAAVKEGHVWTLMSSYNQVRGYHASANAYLLTDILKKTWGFDGMVMSDWGGVHETVGAINAGNDLEMPGPGYLKKEFVARALKNGQITQTAIDDNVRRILRTIIRVGLLDTPRTPDNKIVNSLAHQRLTFEAASQGIVLLKNEGSILPLDKKRLKSIAVIGTAATAIQVGAAGSPTVQPFYTVQPLDGIKKRVAKGTTVRYARGVDPGKPIPASAFTLPGGGKGLQAEYFSNKNLEGKPALVRTDSQIQFAWPGAPVPDLQATNFSVRWAGKLTAPTTGRYSITLSADDGCRLYLDGKRLIDRWNEGSETARTITVDLVAGRAYDLRIEYFQAGGLAAAHLNWSVPGVARFTDAVAAARNSDVAVVFVSTQGQEGEGGDRPSMDLPGDQDALIQAVAAVNKRTIVVLNNGTPVGMTRWLNSVPGLLETWFPGQEGGAACAAVLFGEVNPSGKLPDTLAARREDYPDYGNFPGVKGKVNYAEGIYVGYRHFDKRGIKPLFPFGHGLSYTTFRYGLISLSAPAPDGTRLAYFDVTNTGKRAGMEVVQLYTRDLKPAVDRPIRELKGFRKILLLPGQTGTVSFKVTPREFAYCDVPNKQWKANAGAYQLEAGSSSRDIRQRTKFVLASDYTEPIPFMNEQVPVKNLKDLALDRPVTVSSNESRPDVAPEYAVDGDDRTRWSSKPSDEEWIAIDLGKPTTIDHVQLRWEAAYATTYALQTSTDNKTWTDIYTTHEGLGGIDPIKFAPVTARWVRMYATKRATQFGVSLFSFEVFAPEP